MRVKQRHPPPHAKYLVRRGEFLFTATPCYGMHSPWWVVRTMGGEADPIGMNDYDEWEVLPAKQPDRHSYGCPHDGSLVTEPRPADCPCDEFGDILE